jgi:hypothetical protein
MDPLVLAFTVLTFLLAGFVKGVIGLGLPTIAIGLLAVVMTPAEAAALMLVPSFITNIWQLAGGPRLVPLSRRLASMMGGIVLGAWLGAAMFAAVSGPQARISLGVALALYALLALASVEISAPPRAEPWLSPAMGIATGMVTAATGVFTLPAVPYLQAIGLDKEDLVQALGLSFTVSTVALAGVLAHGGALHWDVAAASVSALVPALIGMALGQRVRKHVSPATFRICFLLGLLLLGAHLAWNSL